MLTNLYTYRGMTASAEQLCEAFALPRRVVVWRIMKGKSVDGIFASLPNPVLYDNKVWTAAMLAEEFNLDESLVYRRWRNGMRGRNLIAPPKEDEVELKHYQELVDRNKVFLGRMLKYHRRRAIDLLKRKKVDCVEEHFDEAAAMLNAQRLVDEARGNLTESTGYTWSAMG